MDKHMSIIMDKPACVNIALVVSDEVFEPETAVSDPTNDNFDITAKEVEATLLEHGKWMTGFYPDQEHLLASYFTKVAQLSNPWTRQGGNISNTCFYIAEEFKKGEFVARHMAAAAEQPYFEKFKKIIKKYGKVVAPMGDPWTDASNQPARIDAKRVDGLDPKPQRQPTDTTLNIALVVPQSNSETVKAVLQKHIDWMKEFYAKDLNILQSAYFTLVPKMEDPFAPPVQAVGEEGPLVIFTINAEFAEWKGTFADGETNKAFDEKDDDGAKKYPTAAGYHFGKALEDGHGKEFIQTLAQYSVPWETGNTIEFNIVGHMQPESKIFHSIHQGA